MLSRAAPPPRHDLILLGGPSTGKTHMALSLQNHFNPASTQQCAFMNSASRLVHGRTLHSAFHLPRDGWTASARALGKEKEALLATWKHAQVLALDEVSMIPADLFADAEFRSGQVKNASHIPWGGLTLLCSGDYMQLPPVAAASLAAPLVVDLVPDAAERGEPARQKDLAAVRGQALWQAIDSCIILDKPHRAHGPLQQFLTEMRAGLISDAAWGNLLQRRLPPQDPRTAARLLVERRSRWRPPPSRALLLACNVLNTLRGWLVSACWSASL